MHACICMHALHVEALAFASRSAQCTHASTYDLHAGTLHGLAFAHLRAEQVVENAKGMRPLVIRQVGEVQHSDELQARTHGGEQFGALLSAACKVSGPLWPSSPCAHTRTCCKEEPVCVHSKPDYVAEAPHAPLAPLSSRWPPPPRRL